MLDLFLGPIALAAHSAFTVVTLSSFEDHVFC